MNKILNLSFLGLSLLFINATNATGINPHEICLQNNICVQSGVAAETAGSTLKLKTDRISKKIDSETYDCFKDEKNYYLIIYSTQVTAKANPVYLEASKFPIENCQFVSTSNYANISISPFGFGTSEETILEKLGKPIEIWEPQNSNQGLKEGEKALVYTKGAKDLDLVVFVIKDKKLIKLWASVMP